MSYSLVLAISVLAAVVSGRVARAEALRRAWQTLSCPWRAGGTAIGE